MCLTSIHPSVFLLYQSLVSSEVTNDEIQQELSDKNNDSALLEELSDAQRKILYVFRMFWGILEQYFNFRRLEKKLAEIENRLPPSSTYPDIKFRSYKDRKRILITGGAGFVGSHLVDKLMNRPRRLRSPC